MKVPLVDLKANYLSIKEEIDSAISKVIDKTAFINGKFVEEFEENFARFCGAKYAIGCSNGTTAIQLAIESTSIKDTRHFSLTVPNTFIATAEAILHAGGYVNFIDVKDDALMDLDFLEQRKDIYKAAKINCVVPVHLFGRTVNVDRIKKIFGDDAVIIEDAAQAHGAKYYDDTTVGSKYTCCFSLFPGKNLGAFGDAGVITTNDESVYKMCKKLRDHGRVSKYDSDVIGYNFRLDALQAAIVNAKLPYLHLWNAKRRIAARLYDELLGENPNVHFVHTPYFNTEFEEYERSVFHIYAIRTKRRDELKKFLESNEIGVGVHYPIPLHLQKPFVTSYSNYPVAEALAKEMLSLPMFPEITEEQVRFVCSKINEFLK